MGVGLTCHEKRIVVLFLALACAGLGFSLWTARDRPIIEQTELLPERGLEAKEEVVGRCNLNTASCDELEKIRGVGPVLAHRILEYREENGPFICLEELLNVKGIGPKILSDMEEGFFCGPLNEERGRE